MAEATQYKEFYYGIMIGNTGNIAHIALNVREEMSRKLLGNYDTEGA